MGSIGAGKMTPIFLATECDNGKYHCSYMGVSGTFHTPPTRREMNKLAKIMSKYKCKELKWEKWQ